MEKPATLPHDFLAEKSLLGCLIMDNGSFDQVSDLGLLASDFYHRGHGKVFEVCRDLFLKNTPIDYVTLCSKLTESGDLENLGGQSFILDLLEDQASLANTAHYAKIIKDKSLVREVIRMALRVAELGRSFQGEMESFIQEVESSFFQLTNRAKTAGMVKLGETLRKSLKDLADQKRAPGEISGIPTGYKELDKKLLGLQPGQLVILAARPAMGKTALALNMAINACELIKMPVAIFSLEMLSDELSLRLLTAKAKVPSTRMKMKDLRASDLKSIGHAVEELSGLPVYINDSSSVTIFDILGQCRKLKSEEGLGMVVIDYLQLMQSHSHNPSREQQIAEISRNLKSMAKELSCPVLALSQLNRAVEARHTKRPNTSDLRESGAIEQDADIVMFIYRDEYYNENTIEPGVAEVIVGKNRSGESGTIKLAFVGEYTSFENLAPGPEGHTYQ